LGLLTTKRVCNQKFPRIATLTHTQHMGLAVKKMEGNKIKVYHQEQVGSAKFGPFQNH
jgi:hypothetical protein